MTAELPIKHRQNFIDGKWEDSLSGKTLGVTNPATEEVLADVAFGGRDDCRKAIAAAAKAMPSWMKLTAYDRAKVLKKTADLMRERADALARTLTMEQGKPVVEAKAEILHSADTFEWFAEEGKRAYGQVIPNSVAGKRHLTIKHPVGVVGASISPWNFPITAAKSQDRAGPRRRLHDRVQARQPDAAFADWRLRMHDRSGVARGCRQPRHGFRQ
ncbi:MAG: aldehyde dehydrogenase family protein [Gemmataceae bacterium]